MADLVEKVARAIWYATEDDDWDYHCGAKNFVRDEARAAIAAVLDDLTYNRPQSIIDAGIEARHRVGTIFDAMLIAKRKELNLESPQKPTQSG